MRIRDARAIALEAAVARGWMSLAEMWELAARWARTDGVDGDALFQGTSLDPLRLASLVADSTKQAETLPYSTHSASSQHLDTRPGDPGDRPPAPSQPPGPRYKIGDLLGAGGVGLVTSALDRTIGRNVAVKTLKLGKEAESNVARRFIDEAHVTAQLEHPNIVPVYDMGWLPDGQPYYTMRIVEKRSLRDVISRPEVKVHWPLVRLLGAFVQVTRALAYAHARGILHNDIKPENVLLGDFGEVYLADWGLAKAIKDARIPAPSLLHTTALDIRASSHASGTPGYIAPEVLRRDEAIDARADLFALGVVLYELLTGVHPFDVGGGAGAMILATVDRTPRRPRDIVPTCPLLLEDLCLKMLEKQQKDRPESADQVAAEVEAFLEGAKERERRKAEAVSLCAAAREPVLRFQHLENERQRLSELAAQSLKQVKGWEPVERKRSGWLLEDRASEAERESGRALAEAIELYTKALGYDAECTDAHRGLAELYWGRARQAEAERRPATQIYYEALVTDHDEGKYAALLRADACLSLTSNPAGANVSVYRYARERDRVLVATDERYLGRTPLAEVRLDPGSYLVVLKAAGYPDVRYAVLLSRGTHHPGEINALHERRDRRRIRLRTERRSHCRRRSGRHRPLAATRGERRRLCDRAVPRHAARLLPVPRRLTADRRTSSRDARAPRSLGASRAARTKRTVGAGSHHHRGGRPPHIPDRRGSRVERPRIPRRLVRRCGLLPLSQQKGKRDRSAPRRGGMGEGRTRDGRALLSVGGSLRPDVLPHARVAVVRAAARTRGHLPGRRVAVRYP